MPAVQTNGQQLSEQQLRDRVMAAISAAKRAAGTPPDGPAAKKQYQAPVFPQNGHAVQSATASAAQQRRMVTFTEQYTEIMDPNKTVDQEEFAGQFKVRTGICLQLLASQVLLRYAVFPVLVHVQ